MKDKYVLPLATTHNIISLCSYSFIKMYHRDRFTQKKASMLQVDCHVHIYNGKIRIYNKIWTKTIMEKTVESEGPSKIKEFFVKYTFPVQSFKTLLVDYKLFNNGL